MRDTTNNSAAKGFDESNIEPVASKSYGKDLMSITNSTTGQKKQRRATDGKFESIRNVNLYGETGKSESRGNDRKGGGRKAGGVEAAFYNTIGGTPDEEDKV